MALASSAPAVPIVIEYDYVGLRSPVDELKAAMAFCRAATTATSSR
jgi:hypothetical protein